MIIWQRSNDTFSRRRCKNTGAEIICRFRTLSTAVDIFLCHSVRENRIPFDIQQEVPNADTIVAIEEDERISKDPLVKGYTNLNELFADLRSYY